jgi:hypothetical protein
MERAPDDGPKDGIDIGMMRQSGAGGDAAAQQARGIRNLAASGRFDPSVANP